MLHQLQLPHSPLQLGHTLTNRMSFVIMLFECVNRHGYKVNYVTDAYKHDHSLGGNIIDMGEFLKS